MLKNINNKPMNKCVLVPGKRLPCSAEDYTKLIDELPNVVKVRYFLLFFVIDCVHLLLLL